jgi:AraC family cel operon transcriptional repressor
MEKKVRFSLNDFLVDDEVFHLAITTINSPKDLIYHCHDYVEVFWVKEGSGKHIINANEIPVGIGSLWMIRSEDAHTFRMDSKSKGLVITNIAFRKDDLDYFKHRYFKNDNTFFWATSKIPFHTVLSKEELLHISNIATKFLMEEKTYLHLDYILLHIFEVLTQTSSNYSTLPHWLSHAIKKFRTPVYFNSGVSGFVALTARSADHVNRTLKKYMQQTLTDTVNELRLEFASKQLIMTNTPIKIISAECGYQSISYFHRLFKLKYGRSPKAYREINKKVF